MKQFFKLSLFVILLTPGIVFAQPTSITSVNRDALECKGKIQLRFLLGKEETCFGCFDDYLDRGQLYLDDGTGEREILYISEGGDDIETFEDWGWYRRSTDQKDKGWVESVTTEKISNDLFILVTIKNLVNRSSSDLNFRLKYEWEGDQDRDDQTTFRANKKEIINATNVIATRDDCNQEKINLEIIAPVTCSESGYNFRLNVEEATDAAFTNPMSIVINRVTASSSVSNTYNFTHEVTNAGTNDRFYRATLEYVGSDGIVYDKRISTISKVQKINLASPTLTSVSDDVCENQINLSWQYNQAEVSNFEIYRTAEVVYGLHFKEGDYINVDNFNIASLPTMTIEALVDLRKLSQANLFYLSGSGTLDIYTDSEGKIKTNLGSKSYSIDETLPTNSLAHFVYQYDANSDVVRIYINNRLIGEESGSLSDLNLSGTLLIGAYTTSGSFPFVGNMYNVRIWNKILTVSEFNQSISGRSADLLLSYDFSEGQPYEDNSAVTMVTDASPHSKNGTLNNFSLSGDQSNFVQSFTNFEKIETVNGDTKSYTDNENIATDTTYAYALKAISTCDGNSLISEFSNIITGKSPTNPISPTDGAIEVDSVENIIRLKWKDNAHDETRYVIKRQFGDAVSIFYAAANDTTFIDNSVIPCRTYNYDIFAENVCGESNESVSLSGRLEPNLTNGLSTEYFAASTGYFQNRVELTWTPQNNTNVDRYRVYRKNLGQSDSLQIAVVSGSEQLYRDETAGAGIIYEYTLVGELDCENTPLKTNSVRTIGFRSATATISGKVSYEGGTAVENVAIRVANTDDNNGSSILFDGVDDYLETNIISLPTSSITIDFWLKRQNSLEGTILSYGDNSMMGNNKLEIRLNASNQLEFQIGSEIISSTVATTPNEWTHWSFVHDADQKKAEIFINDSLVVQQNMMTTIINQGKLRLGGGLSTPNFFSGQLDEFRFWSEARDSSVIARDYNRILSSDTEDILITYSFDEAIGTHAYDRSKTGVFFNSNHAMYYGYDNIQDHWSSNTPSVDQLSVVAFTDSNGNYLHNFVRYSDNGDVVAVVPQLNVHQFEPSMTTLFVGNSQPISNNINFTDISSFPVTGSVFYEGTNCPASGIELRIDGESVKKNGEIVTTTSTGQFNIAVPIGAHRISLYKDGHDFTVGQWPTDGSTHDFQEPVSGIEFIDNTRLKVIGRVVGGTREGNKVPGLGRSINNIGVARIIYESIAGNGCHKDTVLTDVNTGEYLTELYPLEYRITDVEVINENQNISTIDFGTLPIVDLSNAGQTKTARDTVFIAGSNTVERIDSVGYNHRQDFIYRTEAEISVLNEDETGPFIGEETITYAQDTSANSDTTINYKTLLAEHDDLYPIIQMFKTYRAKIKVFEEYNNYDDQAPKATDQVPVTDGTLTINNLLAGDNQQVLQLPVDDGDTLYVFTGGRPNMLQDPNNDQYSFTKTMDITLSRPGQANDIKWYPREGVSIDQRIFRAYVLGIEAVEGTNFVTNGPEKVDIVLRDPPGTGSTATWTQETSVSYSSSWSLGAETSFSYEKQLSAGASFTVGLGISTATDIEYKTGAGFEASASVTKSGETVETFTSTSGYTTNENPEAVGYRSDIYVGKSVNVNFGLAKNLKSLTQSLCDDPNIDCAELHPALPFRIGATYSFYTAPSDQTTLFAYSHNYIVNYLIPNLKTLRNDVLSGPNYTSKVSGDDEDRYGTNNDDPIWGSQMSTASPKATNKADADGPSYTYNGNLSDYGIGTDSVRWYNQQIRLWEEAVADNEKDKVTAINTAKYKDELISFDGETTVSRATETSKEVSRTTEVELSISKEWKNSVDAKVNGTGVEGENSMSLQGTVSASKDTTKSSTTSWEYELTDGDQGDFMSVQVYKSPQGWGPIFQVISGQTGCPHEDAVVTEYYQPGTTISNRTLQRDKVEVDIFPKVVQNVPEGEAATFNVQFRNTSETNDAREYAVRVDPTSNPDGLSVNMDGETITVPNDFALDGGSVLSKVITVERGPEKYEYNDIRLLFYVPCQYAAGTADEVDLVDTATFSVSFLPECTDIRLKEPEDKWVLNNANNDSLTVTIDDYDINKNGFESISLQYRPASESRWTEINKWWHPINKVEEEGDKIPQDRSFIRYFWEMGSFPDGDYHLRTVSECELADNEKEFKEGIADRINPHPFGTPMPSDGICDPGEDIGIRFNEPIDIGSLNALNFDIRGVLNGSPLRHQESVAFDGANDRMEIAAYDLTNRTFSVEAWIKPNERTTGVILSQGLNSQEGMNIRLNNSNKIVFTLAGQSVVSNTSLPKGQWRHIAISYQEDLDRAEIYVNGTLDKSVDTFTESYEATSELYVGSDITGSLNGFDGNMHELRLWSKALTATDIVPNLNVNISPTSTGLIGYWPMNEGFGIEVEDRVRKRNGKLDGASWTILPLGQAFSLNGSSDYLYSTIPTINMSLESDLTFECWFKTSDSGTILSNGYESETNSWSLGVNTDGQITVANNDNVMLSDTDGYNDDDWHHMAIVLERNSAISMYIDGALTKSGDSRLWGGFAGSTLWIGAKGTFNGATEVREDYFEGIVDEVRVWNTARTPEQIARDKNFRLAGDESGLLLYYPFENYELDAGVPVLVQSLDNIKSGEYHLTLGGSTSLNYVQPTPPVKLPRPVEKVNFTYSVNQDEIILTPTDPSGRLEHATLDITTKDIHDLNGNKMESPATWIAFINKNQILWALQDKSLVIEKGESASFDVDIINAGGSAERFEISNLPSWLTPSIISETIAPNSSITIRFDISSGVNIGEYEEDIFLSTDFGFNERFTLNLKVAATPPDWTVDPELYQYSMSYTGQLLIDGVISTDVEDQIAVFVDGELRGSAFVELDPGTNKYLVFLDVYSNSTIGDELEFRIWNASEGTIHTPVTPTDHLFRLHEFFGTPINPQIFEADDRVEESYVLKAGWNWISFPLQSATLSNVNETLEGLSPTENDRILSQDAFDIYTGDPFDSWDGTISASGGFDRKEGYQIYLSESGSFSYSGSLGNPSDEPIELEDDWNWIGFIGDVDIEINEALASLNPTEGDIIKGQRSFAIYESGIGWNGSLDIMRPKESYMIKLATGGTLIYPNKSKAVKSQNAYKRLDQTTKLLSKADIRIREHKEHMTIFGSLDGSITLEDGADYFIAAYSGSEKRGIFPIDPDLNENLYFTVHGHAGEALEFSILNNQLEEVYHLDNKMRFDAQNLIGEIEEPYLFTYSNPDKEEANLSEEMIITPNPFNDHLDIIFNSPTSGTGEVYLRDLNGVLINTIFKGQIIQGRNSWYINDSDTSIPSGVYIITIQTDDVSHSIKVVKS